MIRINVHEAKTHLSRYLARLPPLHRDPFDRMLVAQAIVHGLVVLGPDPLVSQYAIRTTW